MCADNWLYNQRPISSSQSLWILYRSFLVLVEHNINTLDFLPKDKDVNNNCFENWRYVRLAVFTFWTMAIPSITVVAESTSLNSTGSTSFSNLCKRAALFVFLKPPVKFARPGVIKKTSFKSTCLGHCQSPKKITLSFDWYSLIFNLHNLKFCLGRKVFNFFFVIVW